MSPGKTSRASGFLSFGEAGFEYIGVPLNAHVAQLVEHILGKDEVTGSSPVMGSILNTVIGRR